MIYFFDTSALQHRYLDTVKSRGIRKTISDKRNTCFISAASVLEIASTFGSHCRRNSLTRRDYARFDRLFWKDVESGVLTLRDPGPREYRKALHLLEYAGVDLRRKITSFDALIAASCLELALELSAPVTFCLEDGPLFDIVHRISAYSTAIDFRFIGKPRVG